MGERLGEIGATVKSKDPFKVLISTVLSQRTKDENTKRATNLLFSKFKTPEEIAKASERDLQVLVKSAGFFRVKALRIKMISKKIVERFSGKVPDDIENLLSLPGVGRKTANCVLVYGFQKNAIPVDTHVHRISNRLGWVKTKNPEETERELSKKLNERYWLKLNELMVRFGQRICLPRKPKCGECPIKRMCEYGKNR